MKKEEVVKMKMPLTRPDFLKLKKALAESEIERTDIPLDLRMAMDDMWAKDNDAIYDEYRKRGIFGEYD